MSYLQLLQKRCQLKEDLPLKSKTLVEAFPKIKEEKEIPDLLSLVSLPPTNISEGNEQLRLNKWIKYAITPDGRVVSVNRLFTSTDPEDDILKIRRLWQDRLH